MKRKKSPNKVDLITFVALLALVTYGMRTNRVDQNAPPNLKNSRVVKLPDVVTLHEAIDNLAFVDGQSHTYTQIMMPGYLSVGSFEQNDKKEYFFIGISFPMAEPWSKLWRIFQGTRFVLVRVPGEIYRKLEAKTVVDVHGILNSCTSEVVGNFLELKIDSFKFREVITYGGRYNGYYGIDRDKNYQLFQRIGAYSCNPSTPAK